MCGSFIARVRSNLLAGTAVAVGVIAVPSLASAQGISICGSGTATPPPANQTVMGPGECPYAANLGHFSLGPNAAPLTSWDISWVDSNSQISRGYPTTPLGNDFYYLADRTNKAIDVVPIQNNPPIFFITSPTAPFAGATGNNNTSGPNGVMTFTNAAATFGSNAKQVWVADGPTANPACTATGVPVCSTVKIFAGNNAALAMTIPTGNGKPGTVGVNRADEFCLDQPDGILLVANDADTPPFDTFISTNTGAVLGRIILDGENAPGHGPNATNGIEQCQFNPATGVFYQNLPEVNGAGDDSSNGAVIRIQAAAVKSATNGLVPVLDSATIDNAICAGPQGMAIGPVPQILLGCNAQTRTTTGGPLSGPQNSLVINDGLGTGAFGTPFQVLDNQGGSDEVWFEPQSGNYFLANGSAIPAQQLGIASSTLLPPLQNAFVGFSGSTTRRSHSVAGWSGVMAGVNGGQRFSLALLPVAQVGGTPAPFSSTLCEPGSASTGCIALFSNAQ